MALRVAEREPAYCWNDPAGLGRSLPGLAVVDRPALVATWRSLTLPAGRAVPAPCESRPPKSVTFESDHKGQPLSKAGASLLRTTLVCCRQQCGKVDPQLGAATKCRWARGARTTSALCADCRLPGPSGGTKHGPGHAARDLRHRWRAHEEAKAIINERFIVTDVRVRRRTKKVVKVPTGFRVGRIGDHASSGAGPGVTSRRIGAEVGRSPLTRPHLPSVDRCAHYRARLRATIDLEALKLELAAEPIRADSACGSGFVRR